MCILVSEKGVLHGSKCEDAGDEDFGSRVHLEIPHDEEGEDTERPVCEGVDGS